ncbi:hypothetical protein [Chitinophaga sp. LS1]|uniref:hypothetical protein n=1 Tax=Chitinophaga sp. LS1 TaxID=3051176 RepID=UPI002AAB6AAF|nr:hypothetical protein [Chitinophaga sp. LS1]WPV63934.1 hypothetical protein QQL36_19225 [Chitinophaga sp. LS1]
MTKLIAGFSSFLFIISCQQGNTSTAEQESVNQKVTSAHELELIVPRSHNLKLVYTIVTILKPSPYSFISIEFATFPGSSTIIFFHGVYGNTFHIC